MTHSITFETVEQAAIFQNELKGQISDGFWENTANTGWKEWCSAEVLVGNNVGVKGFYPRKNNFNFANKVLVEIVGDRMMGYALDASSKETYTHKDLMSDLKEMKKAIKTVAA